MPRPEELRLTEYGSEDSDYDEDIFNNSIIHSYEKKVGDMFHHFILFLVKCTHREQSFLIF